MVGPTRGGALLGLGDPRLHLRGVEPLTRHRPLLPFDLMRSVRRTIFDHRATSRRLTLPLRGSGSGPQRTAFFTSAAIVFSSAAVSSFKANAIGHIVPLSRFAESLKPSIAYRSLNLAASRKKQTTLPSLLA